MTETSEGTHFQRAARWRLRQCTPAAVVVVVDAVAFSEGGRPFRRPRGFCGLQLRFPGGSDVEGLNLHESKTVLPRGEAGAKVTLMDHLNIA